ncbi:hydantoinase/oxoprolinase family protein [Capillimicrobium parvum]|uniref:Acetophenone carboxylase gamma subunit n=1 Tax=Capillimicrobium parvum TaxID=2884022 RepID=A0A9E6XW76_9ACTN|nr:hydantoinase/oxoprolinase family protein [Capillimicrobium parvum]UGS35569.1 Acetophenone carboxylase gamma subunit [Capillimicrobium parvum]
MAFVGVDIGGTFTDIVRMDESGDVHIDKVPSSGDPMVLVRGITQLGVQPEELGFLGVGTTVGTNALIERKGARTALITTRGFRDLLELRRTDRQELYDLQWDLPAPLIPRCDRLEITERVSWRGEVMVPLAEDEVDRIVRIVRKRGIESVAIVFLHSYTNDAHERRLRDILHEQLPDLEISISSEVLPTYREFERTATVATNAYLAPVMRRYFGALRAALDAEGYTREAQVMQSNGGLGSMRSGASTPARLVRSGPSAGCIALEELGRSIGEPNMIGLDIGGTSADVSMVWQGKAKLSDRNVPEWGLPVLLPSIDIISIGAGGGSIAHIDKGGSLHVGPESAGANPGPACYGRGGTNATSTDAQAVLGRLGSEQLVGGGFPIDPGLAEQAIARNVAEPLGMDVVQAAEGILRILTASMMRAVRLVTIERGADPRDFVLCGFGGNGPMYTVDIARELSIPRVVVPRFPGVFSAYGVLRSDIVYDASQTLLIALEPEAGPTVEGRLDVLRTRVLDEFAQDGIDHEQVSFRYVAELRYKEQLHELAVELPDARMDAESIRRLEQDFHAGHLRTFGHSEPEDAVTLVNLKVFGTRAGGANIEPRAATQTDEPRGERSVYFGGHGFIPTAVVPRPSIGIGERVDGPALITQVDTTCVLPPGSHATCRPTGDLIVEVGA